MILKISPTFVEHKWGSKELNKLFPEIEGIPTDKKIGEIILLSGKSEHSNRIIGTNKTLNEFYVENKQRFFNNYYTKTFPLLVKIIYTTDDLTINVFPNNKKAKRISGYPLGRAEIWYGIDPNDQSAAMLGTNVKKYKDLKELIKNNKWDQVLAERKIEKDKSYNVDFGTLNGLRKDSLVLKFTNNSDMFYKLYDYDRLDSKGKKVTLGTENALKCIKNNQNIIEIPEEIINKEELVITKLNSNYFMTLEKWVINGKVKLRFDKFKKNLLIACCIEGKGIIGKTVIEKWESAVITTDELTDLYIDGNITLLIVNPNNQH